MNSLAEGQQTQPGNCIEPGSEEVNLDEASSNDTRTGAVRASCNAEHRMVPGRHAGIFPCISLPFLSTVLRAEVLNLVLVLGVEDFIHATTAACESVQDFSKACQEHPLRPSSTCTPAASRAHVSIDVSDVCCDGI